MDILGRFVVTSSRRSQLGKASLFAVSFVSILAIYIAWISFSLINLQSAVHNQGSHLRGLASDVHAAILNTTDAFRTQAELNANNLSNWEFTYKVAESKTLRLNLVEHSIAKVQKGVDELMAIDALIDKANRETPQNTSEAASYINKLHTQHADLASKLQQGKDELEQLRQDLSRQKDIVDAIFTAVKEAVQEAAGGTGAQAAA